MFSKIKKENGRVPFPHKKHIASMSTEARVFLEGHPIVSEIKDKEGYDVRVL